MGQCNDLSRDARAASALRDEAMLAAAFRSLPDEALLELVRHRLSRQSVTVEQREPSGENPVRTLPAWLPPFSHRVLTAQIVVEIRFLFSTMGAPGRDPKERDRRRSARKRDVRASTVNMIRLPKNEIFRRRAEEPDDGLRRLPLLRSECRDGERPCPFVSCRFHLFLDVHPKTGNIRLNFPDLLDNDGTPRLEEMLETCSLDVMDRGGVTLEALAEIMNLTRERVRQLELDLLWKFESLKR